VASREPEPLPLLSYTLRIAERRVRATPQVGLDGAPFAGPAVDLLGDDAAAAIEAARHLLAWLDAREPGVRVRSVSVRTDGPRVLVSAEPGPTPDPSCSSRARALRFDPPSSTELRDAGRDAERVVGLGCARALARRGRARSGYPGASNTC